MGFSGRTVPILCAAVFAVFLVGTTVESSAAPTAGAAKKCKKKRAAAAKKKCKKRSATVPTTPSPSSPASPSMPFTPPSVPTTPTCPAVPTSSPGAVYIALGDSVSVGLGAQCQANTFVNRLFANYKSTQGVAKLLNLAVAGQSSSSILSGQVPAAVNEINDAASDTKVVTMDMGGINALGSCPFGSDPCTDAFKSDLDSALNQIQAALASDTGSETVIAMLYPNPYRGAGGNEASWDTKMLGTPNLLDCSDTGAEVGLDDAIQQIASTHAALSANPYPAFDLGGQSFISSDHLHPNDAGYQAIADAFLAATLPCN